MRIITAAVLIAENYLLQLFCENVCYWLSIRIKYLQKILVLIKRLTKSITTSQHGAGEDIPRLSVDSESLDGRPSEQAPSQSQAKHSLSCHSLEQLQQY